MPKQILKIEKFEGGENAVKDPKDLGENESAKAFDVSFDKIGRIRLAGSAGAADEPIGSIFNSDTSNDCHIEPGYGLFAFRHDYNMLASASALATPPYRVDTDFLALAHYDPGASHLQIGIVDGKTAASASASGDIILNSDIIGSLGNKTSHEITFFFADGALRFCDGKFSNSVASKWFGHIHKELFTNTGQNPFLKMWHEDAQSPTTPTSGANCLSVGTAIDGDMGDNELGDEDAVQEKVVLYIEESSEDTFEIDFIDNQYSDTTSLIYLMTTESEIVAGSEIVISGTTSNDGTFLVQAVGTDGDGHTTITINEEDVIDDFPSGETGEDDDATGGGTVRLKQLSMPEELKKKWNFGISYVYEGGQESKIALGYKDTNNNGTGNTVFSSSTFIDMTSFVTIPALYFAFTHAVAGEGDITVSTGAHTWNPRINGFRIYMKNISDVESKDEWLLFIDVDFRKGVFTIPAKDETEYDLIASKISTTHTRLSSQAITSSAGISFSRLPLLSYKAINGYSPNETLSANYKSSTILNGRCYIGNIEQNGATYPDRIIKSPPFAAIGYDGKGYYDTYPESHTIEVVPSDGDSITVLESFGDRILVFKKHSLYILNASEDSEILEEILPSYGVECPNQVTKTQKGVAFVNESGVHLYSGKGEITTLTAGKREPWSFITHGKYAGFHFKHLKPAIGYDEVNNKIIVVRNSRSIDVATKVDINVSASLQVEIRSGTIYAANSNTIPSYGDIFQVVNTDDTSDSKLSAAKGKSVTADDCFVVTNNSNTTNASVEFVDPDTDVFIYDLSTGSISYRGIAYGSNNVGYDLSNFVYSYMLPHKGLILAKDAGGTTDNGTNVDVFSWDDMPQTSTKLEYRTKVFDFGSSSQRKKIYKMYVTFKSHNDTYTGTGVPTYGDSYVQVFYSINHDTIDHGTITSDWTEFSTTLGGNYGGNGLIDDSGNASPDWLTAILKPGTSINNIYSIQFLFKANGTVPKGFEINDISIVYRMKSVK